MILKLAPTFRKCKKCGEEKLLTSFTKNKQSKCGREHQCQSCRTNEINERRRTNKLKAIDYLGGKCCVCNGVFKPAVFDFHHIDSSKKESNPGNLMGRKWERLREELDKCVLLCANCHREVHSED